MTTWREQITHEMGQHGESWDDVQACTLSDAELNAQFNPDFGWPEGKPFTVWTAQRVYFPVTYDGAEWCGSVSRIPDGKPTEHIGR